MRGHSRPVTDYFGTRLDPAGISTGLRAQGLRRFSLLLGDEEVVLRAAEGGEAADRALTWLRGEFSPLLPCRLERVRRVQGSAFRDMRRRPLLTVTLSEIWDEAGPRPRLGGQPGFLSWRRPGGETGVRSATIVAAAQDLRALAWLESALAGKTPRRPEPFDVLLDGLEWGVARRPTIASPAPGPGAPPILRDRLRCRGCGLCARVCPAGCFSRSGAFQSNAAGRCLGCFDCVEACPQDALRPRYGATSATLSRVLRHRPGWLSRLRGGAGQTVPALFPPSYLLPKPGKPGRRWILGLSATTMQEHAAALLERGQVAGAVEEERLARVRHYGYAPLGRPGVTIAADPTLTIEEALPRRAIAALLEPRRLSLDDMDIIAVNGLPARYRRAFSVLDTAQPLPTLRAGRVLYVPHHLCHAASAWRVSGQKSSWVLTVDGRGDRETAAVFRAERGRLRQIGGVLCLTDRSIGGVYETVTRLLGFGAHGQGSVMALGAFGKPTCDLSAFLSRRGRGDYVIHESGLEERFAACARRSDDALLPGHKDLAASLQAALEKLVLALLLDQGVKSGALGLCLAGGVALNCRMNAQLRRTLRPRDMFVQPGANDAGTALGAALEAAAGLGAVPAQIMSDPYLGPGFTPAEAEAALRRARLPYRRSSSIADECAELLARGEVVCWCQGRMEFGPRALGGRSILGDPRRSEMHARVNRLKGREPWRPFGPSILAGHELDWFAEAFDSRFMLFTVPLRSDRAGRVPAVAHVDGTSRPQSVHKETSPLFYSLISRFHGLTDVPMVLNTSFNRRGEPMVCSPRDAVDCFLDMPEADVLALGPFMTRRSAAGAATGKNWLRPDRNVQD